MAAPTLDDRTKTVSPAEAARRIGVAPRTLANWRWEGRGPKYTKAGRLVRYRLLDVERFQAENVRRSTSDRETGR